MKSFAALLDRLVYTPSRNGKLRLLADYFRRTPDPDRGWALAALTGNLDFPNAKAGAIRDLAREQTDEVLFALSYDYVGDLAETTALLWQTQSDAEPPRLADVVEALRCAGRTEVRGLVSGWLDGLDATGRWALLKLITGGLRIGVSARLARVALALSFDTAVGEIEEVWHAVEPPYADLFAWLAGGADRPDLTGRPVFRPFMLAHPLEDRADLDPADWLVEWKWDGIRVQLAARGGETAALFAHRGRYLGGLPGRAGSDAVRRRAGRRTAGAGHRRSRPRPTRPPLTRSNSGSTARPSRRRCWPRTRPMSSPTTYCSGASDGWRPSWRGTIIRRTVRAARRAGLEPASPPPGRGAPAGPRRPDAQAARQPLRSGPQDRPVVQMEARPGRRRADVRPARPRQASFYSDYTFGVWRDGELVPVGKAYFGFTDEELARLDKWVRNNTVNRFGPVREVEKRLVFEVAFDSIHASPRHKSGLAMRFPRIGRIRWDKRPKRPTGSPRLRRWCEGRRGPSPFAEESPSRNSNGDGAKKGIIYDSDQRAAGAYPNQRMTKNALVARHYQSGRPHSLGLVAPRLRYSHRHRASAASPTAPA